MKALRYLQKTPHLFAKVIVAFCVLFAAACSAYALRILSRTGHDPAALLGVILGFFGGELLLMCLKTILRKEGPKNEQRTGSTDKEIDWASER